ncbi:hypothetical protein PanWU01x14_232710 [Parasponia andersonii]|uniref:Uncharacterized protein n=1 Tax=Parasponia andersonii TaxID=3476 RepID=A0A2P5BJN3_PARAD|nr:hypothetical protein PanWU01x14_232710 [Parasponia andersonii]
MINPTSCVYSCGTIYSSKGNGLEMYVYRCLCRRRPRHFFSVFMLGIHLDSNSHQPASQPVQIVPIYLPPS